jgi:5-formyltetrahydrofolate cyclo-ligase
MSTDSLQERKARLRKAVRASRDALPAGERAAMSGLAAARLLDLIYRAGPRLVMLFASFGSEIDTQGLIEALDRVGRRLALPVVAGMDLRAVLYRPGDSVETARYGAVEPRAAEEVLPRAIDVVVVPGLAFDRQGYRVGYGRGYYDRFLAHTRPDARRIGFAFSAQTVPHVPHGPSDYPVDSLVTEVETICCRAERTRASNAPNA